jgi:hypothetical protein
MAACDRRARTAAAGGGMQQQHAHARGRACSLSCLAAARRAPSSFKNSVMQQIEHAAVLLRERISETVTAVPIIYPVSGPARAAPRGGRGRATPSCPDAVVQHMY